MGQFFKAIVTYSFTNEHSEARDKFTSFLEDLGFEEQEDQSTYALEYDKTAEYLKFITKISNFCKSYLKKGDSIDYFRLLSDSADHNKIKIKKSSFRG